MSCIYLSVGMQPVAYFVFRISWRKLNFLWPLVLTQRGPNQVFQIFSNVKKNLLPKGAMAHCPPKYATGCNLSRYQDKPSSRIYSIALFGTLHHEKHTDEGCSHFHVWKRPLQTTMQCIVRENDGEFRGSTGYYKTSYKSWTGCETSPSTYFSIFKNLTYVGCTIPTYLCWLHYPHVPMLVALSPRTYVGCTIPTYLCWLPYPHVPMLVALSPRTYVGCTIPTYLRWLHYPRVPILFALSPQDIPLKWRKDFTIFIFDKTAIKSMRLGVKFYLMRVMSVTIGIETVQYTLI